MMYFGAAITQNHNYKKHSCNGLSIIELLIAVAIFSILVGIGVPAVGKYRKEQDIVLAKEDILAIQKEIDKFYVLENRFPESLSDINMQKLRDPWNNPYYYFRIANADKKAMNSSARRDKHLKPVNSDFDLYSAGPDGETRLPFTAKSAWDDVVRCNNGSYLGLAKDY